MNHKDVHSGCFPTSPTKEHLILGLWLEKRRRKPDEQRWGEKGERDLWDADERRTWEWTN